MKLQAKAEMLIRAKISEVFDSFVKPERLTQFWLGRASGPLKAGARVEWEFMVPGARAAIRVTRFEKNRRLTFRWPDGTASDLRFEKFSPQLVHVAVTTSGFRGKQAATQAIDNTEGFSLVLCDLKTLLETGKSGGMVRDKAALITATLDVS